MISLGDRPSSMMQSAATLLLVSAVTVSADLSIVQSVTYNRYYSPDTTLPFHTFPTSSWLRCATKCTRYETTTCRGYSFSDNLCQLYGSDLILYPNSDISGNVTTIIWSDYGRYRGCWQDDFFQRDISGSQYIMPDEIATIDHCINHCVNEDYTFAGLQWRNECYCGNSYGRYAQKPEPECDTPCLGENTTMCGGGFRNSIYSAL